MSLGNGNVKNGDKGSNFDFELKSLKGFQKIIDSLVTYERTPNIVRATGIGTIAPVVYSFSVSNVGAGNGTLLGQTIKAGETVNFDGGAINNYYPAGTVTYDATGTEFLIIYNS